MPPTLREGLTVKSHKGLLPPVQRPPQAFRYKYSRPPPRSDSMKQAANPPHEPCRACQEKDRHRTSHDCGSLPGATMRASAAQSDSRPLGVTIAEGVTLAFVTEEHVRAGQVGPSRSHSHALSCRIPRTRFTPLSERVRGSTLWRRSSFRVRWPRRQHWPESCICGSTTQS
jgi:hypothetical protein